MTELFNNKWVGLGAWALLIASLITIISAGVGPAPGIFAAAWVVGVLSYVVAVGWFDKNIGLPLPGRAIALALGLFGMVTLGLETWLGYTDAEYIYHTIPEHPPGGFEAVGALSIVAAIVGAILLNRFWSKWVYK